MCTSCTCTFKKLQELKGAHRNCCVFFNDSNLSFSVVRGIEDSKDFSKNQAGFQIHSFYLLPPKDVCRLGSCRKLGV